MKPKTTNQLIQEIVNRQNAKKKDLGLPASWTAEDVMYVAIRNMHERVVGGSRRIMRHGKDEENE